MTVPSGKQAPSGPVAKAVSAEVRAVMARHRVSASQLAPQIGVSQSYLSKRLRDEAAFNLNDLASICEVLGEDVFDLLNAARDK